MNLASLTGANGGFVAVRSSNLEAVAYNPWLGILTIRFHGSRTYEYYGVPPEVHRALMQADSKGRFHYYNIRTSYSYARI